MIFALKTPKIDLTQWTAKNTNNLISAAYNCKDCKCRHSFDSEPKENTEIILAFCWNYPLHLKDVIIETTLISPQANIPFSIIKTSNRKGGIIWPITFWAVRTNGYDCLLKHCFTPSELLVTAFGRSICMA